MRGSVYERVLGPQFDILPGPVRALHDLTTPTVWRGHADVTLGTTWPARLLAALFRLPPSGAGQPLEVRFTPRDSYEVWQRIFASGQFQSRQYPAPPSIHETIGPVTLVFRPVPSSDGITIAMQGVRLLGVPLPPFLVPQTAAREFAEGGRFRFEVSAWLPGGGLLVAYSGWLERAE